MSEELCETTARPSSELVLKNFGLRAKSKLKVHERRRCRCLGEVKQQREVAFALFFVSVEVQIHAPLTAERGEGG
jgi:hypothetical protein